MVFPAGKRSQLKPAFPSIPTGIVIVAMSKSCHHTPAGAPRSICIGKHSIAFDVHGAYAFYSASNFSSFEFTLQN